MLERKDVRLFLSLGGFFVTNVIVAEFIGMKIFSMEGTFGIEPLNMSFFGIGNLSFNLTAGVLLWPVVFVMTDIINEYFGIKGVRFLSNMAIGLIIYAYFMVYLAIQVEPAAFWLDTYRPEVPDIDLAFGKIFGQGMWIIIGSLVAFLIGQIVDVTVFHRLKQATGESKVWLRATGSTLVSQLIDSFVVLFIAFYLGPAKWSFSLVMAVCTVNYIYKFLVAVVLTPVLYLAHGIIDRYLGEELAHELKAKAAQ